MNIFLMNATCHTVLETLKPSIRYSLTDPVCLVDRKIQHFWVDITSMDVMLYHGHIIEVTQDKKKPVSVLITYWKDGEIEAVDGIDYKVTLAEILCDFLMEDFSFL